MADSIVKDIVEAITEKSNCTPEQLLALAVIEIAIRDLEGTDALSADRGIIEQNKKEAKKWFRSPSDEPFAFLWVCEATDIDPRLIIATVKKRGLL